MQSLAAVLSPAISSMAPTQMVSRGDVSCESSPSVDSSTLAKSAGLRRLRPEM